MLLSFNLTITIDADPSVKKYSSVNPASLNSCKYNQAVDQAIPILVPTSLLGNGEMASVVSIPSLMLFERIFPTAFIRSDSFISTGYHRKEIANLHVLDTPVPDAVIDIGKCLGRIECHGA